MAFNITLYSYNKRTNSLDRPTGGGTTESCVMKTVSSVMNPVITIADPNNNIPLYNYAYISSFDRYYFIDDIRYNTGVWTLSLRCDVLASFKEDILSSTQYVLRSASDKDGNIVDNMYPTKSTSTKGKTYAGKVTINAGSPISNYFDGVLFMGCFVVQVISDNVAGVTAYAMNNSAFVSFLNNMMSYVPTDMSDVSNGIAKALYDPIQYITSVRWYPVFPDKDAGTARTSINIGPYTITGISGTCNSFDSSIWDDMYCDLTVTKHSDAASYPYTQLSPFSKYDLYFEPFGLIPLDTTKLYGVTEMRIHWYLEYETGMAHLSVVDKNNTGNLIASSSALFGIELPITQLTVDYIGAGASVIGGGVSTALNMLTGNVLGAIGSGISAIGNGINSMIPEAQTKGTPGSFLIFRGESPCLYYQFMNVVDRDNTRFGSPLCQSKTLSTISGFTVCQDAVVDYTTSFPTSDEVTQIEDLLNSGVFI